jgi:ribonuclease HI
MESDNNISSSDRVLQIYTDGASRGNPGPSALAFIFVQDGDIVHEQSEFLGEKTNIQAEYLAIIKALPEALKITKGELYLFSDSEVVIKQLIGEYKVKKDHLRILRKQIFDLKKEFSSIQFSYVPRQNMWIKKVDKLCNRCLNLNT